MDLFALVDFNRVAAHGGFGRASRATGQPKTTLSRRVKQLEESLGVRLIERSTHAFRLTEEGSALHLRTERLLGEIEETGQAIGGGLSFPRGRLRISAPVLFADAFMGRLATEFRVLYPEVDLDISAEDRVVDPIAERFDVVIRVNPRPETTLVGRCFLRDQTLLVAPASLPRPSADGDLAKPVAAVVMAGLPSASIWLASDNGRETSISPRPVLRLSSFLMVRDAVRAGAGVAMLPRSIVKDDLATGLIVSWGAVAARDVELWVLHTSRRLASPKVAAFVEFLHDVHQANS